jgi:uncharacterized protein
MAIQFFPSQEYCPPLSKYSLLPFQFVRFDETTILLTNDIGNHAFLKADTFSKLIAHQLDTTSQDYLDLRSNYFVSDVRSSVHARVMASRYRTKKSFLNGFTKLHIFVVTLRCDHSCPYCQVSRQSEDKIRYDMSTESAYRSVDLMLTVPAKSVTCEFQGGEALLNFPLVQQIVRYAKEKNAKIGKLIDFVICTNLAPLTNEHLEFCRTHGVKISTSLDGPAFLHDKNRPYCRGSSHAIAVANLQRAQEALGPENVSALMTTTRESLKYPAEIIDEYLRRNLGSIFVRSLSPYGFATKTVNAIGYTSDEFVQFYKDSLRYILEVNRKGRTFPEGYATMILRKILTPFPTAYVDLQSPTGSGFGAVAYNYDGEIYASDEARMLAEMDDHTFRLGNVLESSYEQIFFGEPMQKLAAASCNESLPGCSDCAFQPYCGADPVYHYATQGDMFGHRPTSGFCKKNMAIIRHLFDLIRNTPDVEAIFRAWVYQTGVDEIKLPAPSWRLN